METRKWEVIDKSGHDTDNSKLFVFTQFVY